MSDKGIADTAFFIAGVRALEEHQQPALFTDPYANFFMNDERRAYTRAVIEAHPVISQAIRLRTLLFNDILEQEIARGARQVVNLGCGFDGRHAIYARDGVTFFDVDQEAVIALKTQVLKKHRAPLCESVACNYLEADCPEQLIRAGLDLEKETLFIWEGNTMYLPMDLMFDFLRNLCSRVPRFRIAFDYFLRSVLDGSYPHEESLELVRELQKRLNVVFLSGFDSLDIFEETFPFRVLDARNALETPYQPEGSREKQRLESTASFSKALMGFYRVALLERQGR